MNSLRLSIIALIAAVSPLMLVAAEKAPPIEIGPDVRHAWDALQAADANMGRLIAQNRLADAAAQARIVKESVGTILRGVRPPDESSLKRLVSAGRQMIALADHLADVAASGNRGRADVVHANLHKYVDFVQKHLSPEAVVPSVGSPPS